MPLYAIQDIRENRLAPLLQLAHLEHMEQIPRAHAAVGQPQRDLLQQGDPQPVGVLEHVGPEFEVGSDNGFEVDVVGVDESEQDLEDHRAARHGDFPLRALLHAADEHGLVVGRATS